MIKLRSRELLILLVILMSAALLGSCGSSNKGSGGEEPIGVATVGIDTCYNCHADGVLAKFAEEMIFTKWRASAHGNYESIDESFNNIDLGPDNTGFPYFGYDGLGVDPECTTVCHDQLGDGRSLETLWLEKGIDFIGRVNRPIIGCEGCHGGGGNHFGVGPLEYARPGSTGCGNCHNANFPEGHLPFHPEGEALNGIYEDYISSPHNNSIKEEHLVEGSETDVMAVCSRCHTDRGARIYTKIVTGMESRNDLEAAMSGKADIPDALPVECGTCHVPHEIPTLLGEKVEGLPEEWNDIFKTCTLCHQYFNEEGGIQTASFHDPLVDPDGETENIIVDTHYDDPSTTAIEGYVINPMSDHSASAGNTNSGNCLDCHNSHNADATINNQWAHAAHSGEIAEIKEEGGRNAGVQDIGEIASPWAHYDFKADNRQACQRCHTATGFRNFANDPTTYDPANNVFVATGEQRELLYCWACHMNDVGGVRDPGPLSVTALYGEPADRIAAVPDIGGSNVCMSCHSGRESGADIKSATNLSGNFGSFNSHYLAAGGVLFRTIGYEFEGRDYSNVPEFIHDKIGTSAVPGTGSNGPCVGCHMGSDESHLFDPLEKDESTGLVVRIRSFERICSKCHGGDNELTPDTVNSLNMEYNAALNALQDALGAKGIYYGFGYPYFFTTPDQASQGSSTRYTNWPDHDTLGAAFNLNLLKHIPNGAAHNRFYIKKLVYDSIDFVDDGLMNNSVETTVPSGLAHTYRVGVRN